MDVTVTIRDDRFILYKFPDYQPFMELDGYKENTVVPMAMSDTSEFDSCVLIRESWLNKINNNNNN